MAGKREGVVTRIWRMARAAGLAGLGGLVLAVVASPQEAPTFRKGLWEFSRKVEGLGQPSTLSKKECVNPTEDMRKRREQGAKAGCQISDVARAGNTYRYTATCPVQGGKITSKSVLTAQGDSAYTVVVDSEGMMGGQTRTTKEELVAKRLGDCQ
jgi:hypothetical protein